MPTPSALVAGSRSEQSCSLRCHAAARYLSDMAARPAPDRADRCLGARTATELLRDHRPSARGPTSQPMVDDRYGLCGRDCFRRRKPRPRGGRSEAVVSMAAKVSVKLHQLAPPRLVREGARVNDYASF